MKAVGYFESLPANDERSLIDLDVPMPQPGPRDLLVRIEAIAVNPIDTKVRMRRAGAPGSPIILGWDAAGVVEQVGTEVTLFRPGDEVYYAGSILRQGCNAEYGVVDERIAGFKPRSLTFPEAAAVPLTAITAWECLFDRLRVPFGKAASDDAILIIGAAGGVGSMAVQLARRLTGLTVIGTGSRPESRRWVQELGAHHVLDHSAPLQSQLEGLGRKHVRYILSLTHTDAHWQEIVDMLAPQGEVCLIDDPVDIKPLQLKSKAASLHIELMFVRSTFQTPDMIAQHRLLNEVAALIDEGLLKTTLNRVLEPINAATLREAHRAIESARSIGKIVLVRS